MDPIVANGFVEKGFNSKEKLIEWCADNAVLPAHQYWNEQWVQTIIAGADHWDQGEQPHQPRQSIQKLITFAEEH